MGTLFDYKFIDPVSEEKGSTFKVLFPVRAVSGQREPQVTLISAAAPEKPTLAGARALVVDDEDDAREMVKTVLFQNGEDVLLARSVALKAGFQFHVAKPVEPVELAVLVANVINLPDRP